MKNQDENFYNKVKNLGEVEIMSKIYKCFTDHEVVEINSMDFLKMPDVEKIQYLKTRCIK